MQTRPYGQFGLKIRREIYARTQTPSQSLPFGRLKTSLCHIIPLWDASADKPKVRELYRALKRRGAQPWLDKV